MHIPTIVVSVAISLVAVFVFGPVVEPATKAAWSAGTSWFGEQWNSAKAASAEAP